MNLKTYRFLIVTAFSLLLSAPGYSWDKKGHDITAAIAQRHLSKKTKAQINELLDGKSIIYWAPWMDDASNSPQYKYSKTWHYFDIEDGGSVATTERSPKGDILTAIPAQIQTLKDKTSSREERQLALKFLVHLMGDLHQPMHMGRPGDYGGNTIKVNYFSREYSLHSLWDGGVISRAHDWSHTEWAEEVDVISSSAEKAILVGSFDDWAMESHGVAIDIYNGTSTEEKLSFDYTAKWTSTLELQLLRGGIRLAAILNDIFK